MKNEKVYKLSFMEIALGILFLLQCIMIIYCNLALPSANLDTDNAKLYTHIIEIWKSQRLAVPNWSYTTTLEWDCTTIFSLPLYGLTKNILLSCGLSNILLFSLFMAAIFYLFWGKKLLYPLLCVNLLAVPYHLGMLEYFNMMFFGGAQYVVKVITPILLVGLLLALEKDQSRREKWITGFFFAVFVVFLAVTSISSGIYVTICGVIPVFVAYFGYKLFRLEKVPKVDFLILVISMFLGLWGRHMNEKLFGVMRGESMMLSNAYSFVDTIERCFTGMFELFGGISENGPDVMAFSLQGVAAIEKVCLVLLMLFCGVAAVRKCFKNQLELRRLLLTFIFFWNLLILSVTVTRAGSIIFEHRYHLIGMLPLLCVTGVTLLEALQKLDIKRQKICFLTGYLALLFLCGGSYLEVLAHEDPHTNLKELVEYCKDFDVDYIYMYGESDNSAICRLLGENAIYVCLSDDGSVWAYDYYSNFAGSFMQTTNVIVAVDDVWNDLGDDLILAGHQLAWFDRVGRRNLYYFVE